MEISVQNKFWSGISSEKQKFMKKSKMSNGIKIVYTFKCAYCENAYFTTQEDLENHFHFLHEQADAIFVCEYGGCGQVFYSNPAMAHHIFNSHYKFQCSHCNKSYIRKDHLMNHMKKHLWVVICMYVINGNELLHVMYCQFCIFFNKPKSFSPFF